MPEDHLHQNHPDEIPDRSQNIIAGLEAQVMQLRASVVAKETALAWAHDDLEALRVAVPDLPKRVALTRRVAELEARVVDLLRAASSPERGRQHEDAVKEAVRVPPAREEVILWVARNRAAEWTEHALDTRGNRVLHSDGSDASSLEAGLADAELVVCQTGCVTHQAWWRVQDFCTRTGKQCVLVDRPDALREMFASALPQKLVQLAD
ncbi:DUF2325 domain-containing protein [Bordetella sp. N]|uniref:DUF2325 domain-containing protein n=1 Tax=Bordetella sp. N TaxID=1746199 RepID=UPI00070CA241|nr:DUF2325 domain-containing protein [Bordetella sp. N]ALM82242.1 hypothetical protein ASB57_04060 [Bordetella sp. N]